MALTTYDMIFIESWPPGFSALASTQQDQLNTPDTETMFFLAGPTQCTRAIAKCRQRCTAVPPAHFHHEHGLPSMCYLCRINPKFNVRRENRPSVNMGKTGTSWEASDTCTEAAHLNIGGDMLGGSGRGEFGFERTRISARQQVNFALTCAGIRGRPHVQDPPMLQCSTGNGPSLGQVTLVRMV